MSDAISTQGTLFQRENDSATMETVAEVQSFSGPGGEASEIDVTSLDSTSKEFKLGLQDEGTISLDCILVPGDNAQDGLRADRAAGTVRSFQIVLPDTATTTLTFDALVKGFTITGGVDDVIKASVTLRVTGAVTWS